MTRGRIGSPPLLPAGPPQLDSDSGFAQAAAELADSGNQHRAARAARAVAGLESIGERVTGAATAAAALAGAGDGVSFDALRRAANELTTALSHSARLASDVYQPHGDSPTQCALPFAASQYVRPRRLGEYPTGADTVQPGMLPTLNPRGLYSAHLPICSSCRRAEEDGAIPPRCPLGADTICALAEGAWVEWGDGGPPAVLTAPAQPPLVVPKYTAASVEGRYFVETFDGLVALGVLRQLSGAEAGNPALCAMIAKVRSEPRGSAFMTEAQREATRTRPGGLAVVDIVGLASAAGEAQFHAYVALCGNGSSSLAKMRPADVQDHFGKSRAILGGSVAKAPRMVTGLNLTVNPPSRQMSVEYATIASLMHGVVGAGPYELGLDDGEKAYNQVPIREGYRRYFCVQHPVTLEVYRYERVCFGGRQSCTLYSAITALIKLIIRSGPPRVGGGASAASAVTQTSTAAASGATQASMGAAAAVTSSDADAAVAAYGVTVTGLLDDMASAPLESVSSAHFDWIDTVYRNVRFTISPSKRQRGQACVFLGGHCDSVSKTATAKGEKIFTTYRDLAVIEAAISTAARRGATDASGGERVPYAFFESFVGSFEWLSFFDSSLRLLRQGLRASLQAAAREQLGSVALWPGAPCAASVSIALRRAREGRARAVRYFPGAHARVIAVQAMPSHGGSPVDGDRALQGRLRLALRCGDRRVVGLAGDASLSEPTAAEVAAGRPGALCWGAMYPSVDGAVGQTDVVYGVEDGEAWDSGSLELRPHLDALRRNAAVWKGCVVVMLSDNVGNSYRVNKGNARYGTRAHEILTEIYDLADANEIELLALWLPRACNSRSDALSKCRSVEEARAWATSQGHRLLGSAARGPDLATAHE